MYNGDVVGEYVYLKENEAIELRFKMKGWKKFADLMITFENVTHSSITTIYY